MKARPGLCRLDRWCLTQTVRAGPGLVRAGAETGSAVLAPTQNSGGWLTGGGVGGGMVVWPCGPTDSRWCVGAQLSPESAEEYIEYLKSSDRLDEAAQRLATVVNDERFVSKAGKSNYQVGPGCWPGGRAGPLGPRLTFPHPAAVARAL